jgi:hypothetical protein
MIAGEHRKTMSPGQLRHGVANGRAGGEAWATSVRQAAWRKINRPRPLLSSFISILSFAEQAGVSVEKGTRMEYRGDHLPESVSVYYRDRGFLFSLLLCMAAYLIPLLVAALFSNAEIRQAVFVRATLVAAALVIAFTAVYLSDLRKIWPYTFWAGQRRKTYMHFDRQAITLLGDTRILWSSITYVRVAILRPMMPPRCTCLILGLAVDLRRNLKSIAHLDELTKNNPGFGSDGDGRATFLSLEIACPWGAGLAAHLTLSGDKIGELAEMYWSAVARTRPAIETAGSLQAK